MSLYTVCNLLYVFAYMVHPRIATVCNRGLNHTSKDIRTNFGTAMHNILSPLSKNIKLLSRKINTAIRDINILPVYKVKQICKASKPVCEEPWKINLIKELLGVRDGVTGFIFDAYEISECMYQLRIRYHVLRAPFLIYKYV